MLAVDGVRQYDSSPPRLRRAIAAGNSCSIWRMKVVTHREKDAADLGVTNAVS